jgi:hypothetical protein
VEPGLSSPNGCPPGAAIQPSDPRALLGLGLNLVKPGVSALSDLSAGRSATRSGQPAASRRHRFPPAGWKRSRAGQRRPDPGEPSTWTNTMSVLLADALRREHIFQREGPAWSGWPAGRVFAIPAISATRFGLLPHPFDRGDQPIRCFAVSLTGCSPRGISGISGSAVVVLADRQRRVAGPAGIRGRRHDATPARQGAGASASNHRRGWPWRQSLCWGNPAVDLSISQAKV